jgi:uncharacterized protein (TIRG00374 family)
MTAPPAPAAAVRDIAPPPARPRRGWRLALFAAGVAAIAAVLALVGWRPIVANLALIGPYFLALVALYSAAQIAFTLGWWVIVARPHPMSFGELFGTYLAGDSVNYVTGVGGEPVKAHLLREKMGFGPALATIMVHRNADVLAQWLFLFAGAVVALTRFNLPPLPRYLVLAGLLLLGGLALGFTTMQRRGFFGPFLKQLLRIRPLAERLRHLEADAHRLDEKIRVYHQAEKHRRHFALAVLWGTLGWCGGLVETWIVLRLLSPDHTFASAFAIETLAMILNSILLVIPGKIGSAEGIRLGVAALVGLTPAQGAAYALVRRARELIWLTPGIVLLLKHHLIDVGQMRLEKLDLSEEAPR